MENTQQANNPQMLKSSISSPKPLFLGLVAFLIIIIASGVGYYLGTNKSQEINPQSTNQVVQVSPTNIPTPTIPATASQKITPPAEIANEITTAQLKSIPLSSTEGWKTISFKSISFKIPSDLTFKDLEDSSNIGIVSQEGTFGPRATVGVQDYKGGSRRQEYFGNDYYDCHYIYEEALFGTVKALQIAADFSWCQGGYAGGIVAVIDNKLVSIGPGLQYNLDTKEILRYPFIDTVVSTLKSTQ